MMSLPTATEAVGDIPCRSRDSAARFVVIPATKATVPSAAVAVTSRSRILTHIVHRTEQKARRHGTPTSHGGEGAARYDAYTRSLRRRVHRTRCRWLVGAFT